MGILKTKTMRQPRSMTEGSLWSQILLFALPLACTGILQQLFNAADIAVVGNFTGTLGAVCMAACGACGPIVNLMVNLFVGLSLGSNVLVAQAIGAQDEKRLYRTVSTSLFIALSAGVLAAIVGMLFAVQILEMMAVPEEVLPMATLYLRIYMAAMPVIVIYNFEAALFRGAGNTRTPLLVLSLGGVINVLLNLILVVWFHLAVEGVAIGTLVSNAVSALILFVMLLKGNSGLKINLKKLQFDGSLAARCLKVGVPAGLQGAVFSVANIIVQTATNSLGTNVIAAGSAAINVEATTFNVLNSYGQACVTFVGQNYGAGKLERCKQVLKVCLVEDFISVASIAALCCLFGDKIVLLFNSNPEVVALAYYRIRVLCLSHCASLFYEVFAGYLRAFGISTLPAILTALGVCGIRCLWVFFYFPVHHTYQDLMLVYPVSLISTSVVVGLALLYCHPASRRLQARAEKEKLVLSEATV